MWEINGLQLECDLEDVETAEKVEKALRKMSETTVEKTDSKAEAIKFQCNVIKVLFSEIFGDDTAESIFKDVKLNRRLYTDVLYSFYDFMSEQKQAMVRRSNALSRYTPKARC
jgi:negative regulator of sigma E activity